MAVADRKSAARLQIPAPSVESGFLFAPLVRLRLRPRFGQARACPRRIRNRSPNAIAATAEALAECSDDYLPGAEGTNYESLRLRAWGLGELNLNVNLNFGLGLGLGQNGRPIGKQFLFRGHQPGATAQKRWTNVKQGPSEAERFN